MSTRPLFYGVNGTGKEDTERGSIGKEVEGGHGSYESSGNCAGREPDTEDVGQHVPEDDGAQKGVQDEGAVEKKSKYCLDVNHDFEEYARTSWANKEKGCMVSDVLELEMVRCATGCL